MFRLMLLFSLLATTVALPRPLDRGPVRNPRQPLDIANPQDENYVLRNGTLAFNFTNYGFFGNDGPSQSSSLDDPCSGTWAPQFEYPEGSDAQYLFQGGLWVGALIDYGDSLVPRVSVGTDGWQNPSVAEFHAGAVPNNGIILRSNLPDATDCFGNSIYDPNAQANIEAVAVYSDTLTDQLFVMPVPLDGQHRPLGLEITQIARLWTAPEFARFVILDYEIENIGEHALVDPVIGFYMDCDVGVAGVNNEHIDDITGAFVIDSETDRTIAWTADNDGRSVGGGPVVLPHAFGMAPLSIELGSIAANYPGSYNWWNPNGDVNIDFGPAWQDTPTWTSSRGTPIRDSESYDILAGNEIDYGTYAIRATHSAQNDDYECHAGGEHEWREVNLDDGTQRNVANGYDVRFLLGNEKFGRYDYTDTTGACHYRLEPHETSTVTFVMFIGEYFHDPAHPQPDPANLDSTLFRYEGLRWTYALSRVVYDSDYTFQPPSHPQNMLVVQAESGQIPLAWDSPAHGEIAGYRVYGRPDSGQGERVLFTPNYITDEEYTITGLTNGDDWLIEVASVDVHDFESAPARRMVRVGAIPIDNPLVGHSEGGVNSLSWTATDDPTFSHYRLVRLDSTVQTEFDNLTTPGYNDDNVISGRHYSYTLYLHNSLGVTSLPSNSVTLTPFAPRNTILVYDETKTPAGPDALRGAVPDSLVRQWYDSLLTASGEPYAYIDLANTAAPLTLQSLAAHEIVIWHSENPQNARTGVQIDQREAALREYVSIGGKLIRFGRHTLLSAGFVGGRESRQRELEQLAPLTFDSVWAAPQFNPSNPVTRVMATGADFTSAVFPPAISWDESKVSALNYIGQTGFEFLPGVDFFWPRGNTWPLCTVRMHQDDTTGFANATCALVGPGEILFGFPLYFIPAEQAQDILESSIELLRTQELTTPEPPTPLPSSIALHQNYPNPFNATTVIEFELPAQMEVALNLYNIRGQLVRTLFDGAVTAGHHRVMLNGEQLASGLYFYRLEAGGESQTRKLLLLK